jgi:hypothetical protein
MSDADLREFVRAQFDTGLDRLRGSVESLAASAGRARFKHGRRKNRRRPLTRPGGHDGLLGANQPRRAVYGESGR